MYKTRYQTQHPVMLFGKEKLVISNNFTGEAY